MINVKLVRPKNPTMLSTMQCDALSATLDSHDKIVSFFTNGRACKMWSLNPDVECEEGN